MTRLLLDTHTFLWFVRGDAVHLSAEARRLIEDPGQIKLVSVASAWETAIKVGTGKLRAYSIRPDCLNVM